MGITELILFLLIELLAILLVIQNKKMKVLEKRIEEVATAPIQIEYDIYEDEGRF